MRRALFGKHPDFVTDDRKGLYVRHNTDRIQVRTQLLWLLSWSNTDSGVLLSTAGLNNQTHFLSRAKELIARARSEIDQDIRDPNRQSIEEFKTILDLPAEMWPVILKYLDSDDYSALMRTHKILYEIVRDLVAFVFPANGHGTNSRERWNLGTLPLSTEGNMQPYSC